MAFINNVENDAALKTLTHDVVTGKSFYFIIELLTSRMQKYMYNKNGQLLFFFFTKQKPASC